MRKTFYPGFERVPISRAVRAELLLSQVQRAIAHQYSWQRPWQRYEPLSGFLDSEIWPTDQSVLQDLSFAKLAIEILSEAQRRDLDAALVDNRTDAGAESSCDGRVSRSASPKLARE